MNGYYIEKSSQLFPISPKDRTWAAAIYAKRTKWMLFDHEDDDCDGDDDNQTASGIEKTWNAIWGASFWYKKKKSPKIENSESSCWFKFYSAFNETNTVIEPKECVKLWVKNLSLSSWFTTCFKTRNFICEIIKQCLKITHNYCPDHLWVQAVGVGKGIFTKEVRLQLGL